MKKLIGVLSEQILGQIKPGKTNIVRIENFDNPIVYCSVCKNVSGRVDFFIAKLAKGKYTEFVSASNPNWVSAISYLHQGNNASYYATGDSEYQENSFVDFNNAITRWRNESASFDSGKTALVLLMGTEVATDIGGLLDTSYVISPKELMSQLVDDYSAWFVSVLNKNGINTEECRRAIHTLYRALFTSVNVNLFKLSDFIDEIDEIDFSSPQELINYICETLNRVWAIPSIIETRQVPKVQALSKGTLNSAKTITNAVRFIERADDIPSDRKVETYKKQFEKYAEKKGINVSAPFPSDTGLFSSFHSFRNCVIDYLCGKDIAQNRSLLLKTDYAIIADILDTKLEKNVVEQKTAPISGEPVEAFSKMFLDAADRFYEDKGIYPNSFAVSVDRITLSNCVDDQKEEAFMPIASFLGGILDFFDGASIDYNGELVSFSYDMAYGVDPFNFSNYNIIEDNIRCTGKWGDPCKIQFVLTLSNGSLEKKYEYKWVFSPYCAWPNAFQYLCNVLFRDGGDSYLIPTLSSCSNIQDYLGCESEDEFYAQLIQLRDTVLFDKHRKEIHKYFTGTCLSGCFDVVCNDFINFALQLSQHGLFNALENLRSVVKSYTALMESINSEYKNLTDVQREKIALLLNCFTITSNPNVVSNCNMDEVIVPAYNPVMLEKIDAKQLFVRSGFAELMHDRFEGQEERSEIKSISSFAQLAAITQGLDTILKKSSAYMTCQNMWEYFGVYFAGQTEGELLSGNSFGLSMVTDDEDASAMLRATPMSNIIVRNVMDYVHTFPARVDGLNVAFIAPADMQHIVSAIHSIAKTLEDSELPATINVRIICLNSKKNSSAYLRKWLDSYFNEERSVNVNTYLRNITINDIAEIGSLGSLLENCDLCFTYNVLTNTNVQFATSADVEIDKDQAKFPMTFIPDTIAATHGKSRKINISQFQFLASKYHTQSSHIAGYPDSIPGVYRAFKTLELKEIQEQIIEIAHNKCKWVVCVDPAIDRHMLEQHGSKIIGFTTGEGSYGELNVTVSARADVLVDIKQMLKKRITEKFKNWDSDRLQKAADYCVDVLSQYMDGSRILKALNPYDYEIHNYLAYILSLQMLNLTQEDNQYIVRSLISLDSYKHWFEDDKDNMRPDFMLLEIPKTPANLNPDEDLHIDVKIIECKMGYQSDSHISKAKHQLEKGLRTMSAKWGSDEGGIMHRYWLNQLYRAIIFSPLSLNNTSKEYSIIRDKIFNILNGKIELSWSGDIFAFWLDSNSDELDEYYIESEVVSELQTRGVNVSNLACHSCGQMSIQKMLLPPTERNSVFTYNDVGEGDSVEDDNEEYGNQDETVLTPEQIVTLLPKPKDLLKPFICYIASVVEATRQSSLEWFAGTFSILPTQKAVKYPSNGHPVWETILDSVISKVRQDKVIENSAVGSFHLTVLGQMVVEKLSADPAMTYSEAIEIDEHGADTLPIVPNRGETDVIDNLDQPVRVSFTFDEAILLLDTLLNGRSSGWTQIKTAEVASQSLRSFAETRGEAFDDSYRSPGGLVGRLNSLSAAIDEDSSVPTTKVFTDVAQLYKNHPDEYAKRLLSLKSLANGQNPESVSIEPKKEERLSPKTLKDVRLLLGKNERNGEPYYWEFGNRELNNRHLLINGNSGCGKTYCIQTLLLEAAKQGVSAVVFDYTGGFASSKLDPLFKEAMGEHIEQRIVKARKIPVNPFVKHDIQIDDDLFVPEENADVADKIAEIFKSVYSLGDQQRSAVYSAVLNGLKIHGDKMSFPAMVEELEKIGTNYAKTVISKIQTFTDFNPFTTDEDFHWSDIRDSDGIVYVFQLIGYGREIQVLLTELLLWDIWSFCVKNGDESKPFILVLDEAQNLSHGEKSPSAKILTEGRKFGLSGWYATQFMKPQLTDDEIQRLQQAGQKLYFCPPDDGVMTVAKNIDITAQGAKEWSEKLKKLKKGECVTCGSMLKNNRWSKYEPRIIKVTSFQERLRND